MFSLLCTHRTPFREPNVFAKIPLYFRSNSRKTLKLLNFLKKFLLNNNSEHLLGSLDVRVKKNSPKTKFLWSKSKSVSKLMKRRQRKLIFKKNFLWKWVRQFWQPRWKSSPLKHGIFPSNLIKIRIRSLLNKNSSILYSGDMSKPVLIKLPNFFRHLLTKFSRPKSQTWKNKWIFNFFLRKHCLSIYSSECVKNIFNQPIEKKDGPKTKTFLPQNLIYSGTIELSIVSKTQVP